MANFHPSENDLLEFSAGNLDWALSICISAHLQLCPACKNKVAQFNSIGGSVLSQAKPVQVADGSLNNVLARIRTTPHEEPAAAIARQHECARALPSVVQKLLPKDRPLKWSFVSPSLRAARLETGQDKYEISFHRIKRGGKVAEHGHRGLEVTMVLEGSFSDANGNYVVGDYIVKQPGETHRPMASQDQDCLCLSVVEAPVKVTGLLGKVINPFLSIHPG